MRQPGGGRGGGGHKVERYECWEVTGQSSVEKIVKLYQRMSTDSSSVAVKDQLDLCIRQSLPFK